MCTGLCRSVVVHNEGAYVYRESNRVTSWCQNSEGLDLFCLFAAVRQCKIERVSSGGGVCRALLRREHRIKITRLVFVLHAKLVTLPADGVCRAPRRIVVLHGCGLSTGSPSVARSERSIRPLRVLQRLIPGVFCLCSAHQ